MQYQLSIDTDDDYIILYKDSRSSTLKILFETLGDRPYNRELVVKELEAITFEPITRRDPINMKEMMVKLIDIIYSGGEFFDQRGNQEVIFQKMTPDYTVQV